MFHNIDYNKKCFIACHPDVIARGGCSCNNAIFSSQIVHGGFLSFTWYLRGKRISMIKKILNND